MRVVRTPGGNAPEGFVSLREGLGLRRIGYPGRQKAVATATVVYAAGIEAAKTTGNMQSLERPVSIHDPVVVPALGPEFVPRAMTRRRRLGNLRGPRSTGRSAPTARETQESIERRVLGRISRKKRLGIAPRTSAQSPTSQRSVAQDLVEPPLGVHSRVNEHEGPGTEFSGDREGPATQPVNPVVGIRRIQDVGKRIQGREFADACGDPEQVQFVVPEHVVAPPGSDEFSDPLQGAQVGRTPVDDVAHDPEVEGVPERRGTPGEEYFQFFRTTLDVSNENRSGHGGWIAPGHLPRGDISTVGRETQAATLPPSH